MVSLQVLNNFEVSYKCDDNRKQISDGQKKVMERQGYRFVLNHSAVKICEWTKKMLRGQGVCYKFTFYGIRSYQCLQMTTSMFCASRCKFCWRGQKAPVSKSWYGPVDDPIHIINHAIDEHLKLLNGFKSNSNTSKEDFKKSRHVRHVALSLTGEPITYPLINEILNEFHKRRISTFLVTNAQFPEQIEKIKHVTQIYLSVDAPTKESLKEIDRPLFKDYWQRLNKCLEILSTRKYRTCIRLTMIRHENMDLVKEYANLLRKGNPDFIELKSYMWVGESQRYYGMKNMPFLKEIRDFAKELLKFLPDYEYISSHEKSHALLLMKKSLGKRSYINFPRFFELVENNSDFSTKDYSSTRMESNE